MDVHSNLVPYLGDIQLREFTSFVTNHMHWWSTIHTIQKNEDTSTLWVRREPQSPISLRIRNMRQLQSPKKASQMEDFQQEVVSSYFNLISQQDLFAREGNQGRWDASSIFFRERDPYCVEKLKYALS